MVWKVRADCTFTTAANKTARQSQVESMIASYPEAYPSPITTGRFPGGVVSQSTTRFTVCYDVPDEYGAVARAFADAVHSAMNTSAKSATLVSVHKA